MADVGRKRTTLRLPGYMHAQLRKVAAERHVSAEAILEEALRRELERLAAGPVREVPIPSEMTPILAELFLESMPAYALIKDTKTRIVWVNGLFERHIASPLLHLVGKSITETGVISDFQKESIEANILAALHGDSPGVYFEQLTLKGRGSVLSRAHRFTFNCEGHRFLGDVSFVEDDFDPLRSIKVELAVARMEKMLPDANIDSLYVPFLEAAPVAMAIKKPETADSVILWANDQYSRLAGSSNASSLIGRTTRSIFGLALDHPILQNDAAVAATASAGMYKEALAGRGQRWSLRFPILDRGGKVALIGVVSPEHKLAEATRV